MASCSQKPSSSSRHWARSVAAPSLRPTASTGGSATGTGGAIVVVVVVVVDVVVVVVDVVVLVVVLVDVVVGGSVVVVVVVCSIVVGTGVLATEVVAHPVSPNTPAVSRNPAPFTCMTAQRYRSTAADRVTSPTFRATVR